MVRDIHLANDQPALYLDTRQHDELVPPATLARVRERFGHLVGVGLDAPDSASKR